MLKCLKSSRWKNDREKSVKYSFVIHNDNGSDYGVTLSDLPACFSAGDSFEQALVMMQEAAELVSGRAA